jgi:hypothetical protein
MNCSIQFNRHYTESTGVAVQARKGTSCSCPQSAFSQVNSNLFGQPSASFMLCRNECLSPQLPHSHSTKKTCIVCFPSRIFPDCLADILPHGVLREKGVKNAEFKIPRTGCFPYNEFEGFRKAF